MATVTVRAAITSNSQALSGTFATGGLMLGLDDDVLVARETPSTDSGLWKVKSGAWERHPSYNTEAAFTPMLLVVGVREGEHGGRNFQYKNPTVPAQLGVTLLNFKPVDLAQAPKSTDTITVNPATGEMEQADTGVTPGTYPNLTATVTAEGNVVGAYGTGTGSTYIEGLEVIWNSTTSVTVKAGTAWIQGLNRLVELFEDKVFTGLSLSASTWYYPYLFEPTAGVGDVELVTTAPAAPYRGEARSKSGDASKRYLRPAIRAGTAGAIRRFEMQPDGWVRWIEDMNTTLRAVSGASNTTFSAVDVSPFCPPTAEVVMVVGNIYNPNNASSLFISAAGDGMTTVGGSETAAQVILGTTNPTNSARLNYAAPVALIANVRTLHHRQSGVGVDRTHHVDLIGYLEGR